MGGRAPDQKVRQHHDFCCNKTLSFLTLNVCGLMNKLLLPEFHSLIAEYDIIGLQESKTDSLDTLNIPAINCFANIEKILLKRNLAALF